MDERDLVKAILADPDRDEPRLVYADWLLERGDLRGELIQVQCALAARAGLPPDPMNVLRRREDQLLVAHGARWCNELAELEEREAGFSRGMIESLNVEAPRLSELSRKLEHRARIRRLVLRGVSRALLPQMLKLRLLNDVRSLDMIGELDAEGARLIVESDCLRSLSSLRLSSGLGAEGACALASWSELATVTDLALDRNDLGNEGARALASSPHLSSLKWLDLEFNQLGTRAVNAIAGSTSFGRLSKLLLRDNALTEDDALSLMKSPRLPSLVYLDLSENGIQAAALRPKAEALGFSVTAKGFLRPTDVFLHRLSPSDQ